jgi:hypothetical protein
MKIQRKVYDTPAEKRKDFFLGIGLFILMNGFFALVFFWLSSLPSPQPTFFNILMPIVSCLPFLANVVLMLIFALTRHWIALGMLAFFAFLLALGIVAGIILTIVCFVQLGNSSP